MIKKNAEIKEAITQAVLATFADLGDHAFRATSWFPSSDKRGDGGTEF